MKRLALALLGIALAGSVAQAEPVRPLNDQEVVERLPQGSGRADTRALRRAWAANPGDVQLAVSLAKRDLAQAQDLGDPRFAGRALAALQAWPDAAAAPDEVLLLRATIQQHLHAFDDAAALLEVLLARRPGDAQAWLTLATVRRVQGRWEVSDRACQGAERAGAALHAQACLAENQGLRGQFDAARQQFDLLLRTPRLPASTRQWLATSLAELEVRAGRPVAADQAYRSALAAEASAYTALSYADFLIDQRREREALRLLASWPRSDGVLLRLAIAGQRAGASTAASDVAELSARMAQAALRPDALTSHAREQSMHALWIERQPDRALRLAWTNVKLQREPVDAWLLAQAAEATGREAARREVRAFLKEVGWHDKRLDALR
jgi:tetratricopeptide (TPR) repeat protein